MSPRALRGQFTAGIRELRAEVWERVYRAYPHQKCQNGGQ